MLLLKVHLKNLRQDVWNDSITSRPAEPTVALNRAMRSPNVAADRPLEFGLPDSDSGMILARRKRLVVLLVGARVQDPCAVDCTMFARGVLPIDRCFSHGQHYSLVWQACQSNREY